MSLYDDVADDIEIAVNTEKPNSDIANWSNNSFKLLQAQLQAKKHQQQHSTLQTHVLKRDKPSTSIAPVIDLSDKRKKKELEIPVATVTPTKSVLTISSEYSNIQTRNNEPYFEEYVSNQPSIVEEEYDPLKPNDYETLLSELKKKKMYKSPTRANTSSGSNDENESKSSSSHHRKRNDSSSSSGHHHHRSSHHDRDRHHSDRHSKSSSSKSSSYRESTKSDTGSSSFRPRYDDEEYDDYERDPKRQATGSFAAFAPPPSLIEEDKQTTANPADALRFEQQKTQQLNTSRSLAEKMMEKMGYKEGEGLGRNKQGMSVALQVEKTGKRSGRIIHEKDVKIDPIKETTNDVMKNPSKVILLKNMVGPGEVDGELEGETKEECQKYGEVNKVVIFEIPESPPEEAVRIFVEFKTLPSAIKALIDLNGRFFGGRTVKATFYNFDKFRSYNLADEC